jgi:hypothetical protein
MAENYTVEPGEHIPGEWYWVKDGDGKKRPALFNKHGLKKSWLVTNWMSEESLIAQGYTFGPLCVEEKSPRANHAIVVRDVIKRLEDGADSDHDIRHEFLRDMAESLLPVATFLEGS